MYNLTSLVGVHARGEDWGLLPRAASPRGLETIHRNLSITVGAYDNLYLQYFMICCRWSWIIVRGASYNAVPDTAIMLNGHHIPSIFCVFSLKEKMDHVLRLKSKQWTVLVDSLELLSAVNDGD